MFSGPMLKFAIEAELVWLPSPELAVERHGHRESSSGQEKLMEADVDSIGGASIGMSDSVDKAWEEQR